MTYGLGILTQGGLVFATDSRTNAGVDHIATFRKMAVFEDPGQCVLVLLTAGNLATTQAVCTLLAQRSDPRHGEQSLFAAETLFDAARVVGNTLREVVATDAKHVEANGGSAGASFIFGGQRRGSAPRLFQIYSAGNFVEATPETPYVQIGETKYGKPIVDRVVRFDMTLKAAAKLCLLSFDSTMRSNLSVGLPIDLMWYHRDSFSCRDRRLIGEDDAYFSRLRRDYCRGLTRVARRLPEPDFVP